MEICFPIMPKPVSQPPTDWSNQYAQPVIDIEHAKEGIFHQARKSAHFQNVYTNDEYQEPTCINRVQIITYSGSNNIQLEHWFWRVCGFSPLSKRSILRTRGLLQQQQNRIFSTTPFQNVLVIVWGSGWKESFAKNKMSIEVEYIH